MATTNDFANFILDNISDEKAIVKKMFGEYALYYDNKVVGFLCDNILFFKITEHSEKFVLDENLKLKKGPAYPGSKDYFIANDELLENGKYLKKIMLEICLDVEVKKAKKKIAKK